MSIFVHRENGNVSGCTENFPKTFYRTSGEDPPRCAGRFQLFQMHRVVQWPKQCSDGADVSQTAAAAPCDSQGLWQRDAQVWCSPWKQSQKHQAPGRPRTARLHQPWSHGKAKNKTQHIDDATWQTKLGKQKRSVQTLFDNVSLNHTMIIKNVTAVYLVFNTATLWSWAVQVPHECWIRLTSLTEFVIFRPIYVYSSHWPNASLVDGPARWYIFGRDKAQLLVHIGVHKACSYNILVFQVRHLFSPFALPWLEVIPKKHEKPLNSKQARARTRKDAYIVSKRLFWLRVVFRSSACISFPRVATSQANAKQSRSNATLPEKEYDGKVLEQQAIGWTNFYWLNFLRQCLLHFTALTRHTKNKTTKPVSALFELRASLESASKLSPARSRASSSWDDWHDIQAVGWAMKCWTKLITATELLKHRWPANSDWMARITSKIIKTM